MANIAKLMFEMEHDSQTNAVNKVLTATSCSHKTSKHLVSLYAEWGGGRPSNGNITVALQEIHI